MPLTEEHSKSRFLSVVFQTGRLIHPGLCLFRLLTHHVQPPQIYMGRGIVGLQFDSFQKIGFCRFEVTPPGSQHTEQVVHIVGPVGKRQHLTLVTGYPVNRNVGKWALKIPEIQHSHPSSGNLVKHEVVLARADSILDRHSRQPGYRELRYVSDAGLASHVRHSEYTGSPP